MRCGAEVEQSGQQIVARLLHGRAVAVRHADKMEPTTVGLGMKSQLRGPSGGHVASLRRTDAGDNKSGECSRKCYVA